MVPHFKEFICFCISLPKRGLIRCFCFSVTFQFIIQDLRVAYMRIFLLIDTEQTAKMIQASHRSNARGREPMGCVYHLCEKIKFQCGNDIAFMYLIVFAAQFSLNQFRCFYCIKNIPMTSSLYPNTEIVKQYKSLFLLHSSNIKI